MFKLKADNLLLTGVKPQGSTINMNNLISAVLTINQDVEPVF